MIKKKTAENMNWNTKPQRLAPYCRACSWVSLTQIGFCKSHWWILSRPIKDKADDFFITFIIILEVADSNLYLMATYLPLNHLAHRFRSGLWHRFNAVFLPSAPSHHNSDRNEVTLHLSVTNNLVTTKWIAINLSIRIHNFISTIFFELIVLLWRRAFIYFVI